MLFDHGFRTPGKVQFLAALDYYQPGVHESTQDDSAVLISLKDVVRVCFLDTARSKQPVSEYVI
jgi:hypothetical protein